MTESEAFGESWRFKASDLEKNGRNITIEAVSMKAVGKNYDPKPALHFQSEKKVLLLNRTQFRRIMELTGESNTDNWSGYRIKLCPGTIHIKEDNGTKTVDTIIIEPADPLPELVRESKPAEKSAESADFQRNLGSLRDLAEVPASSGDNGDDESIPF